MFRLNIFTLWTLVNLCQVHTIRHLQIAEDLCVLASPGNLLQEASWGGILEETLKRYLKKGWILEIIPEL